MASSTKTAAKKSGTKSTGRKSAAKKASGAKRAAAAKKSTGRKSAASTTPQKNAKPGMLNVRRYPEHQETAHAATAIMRHGGRNENRGPVATANVADVLDALDGRKPEELAGLSTAALIKLARGEKVANVADVAKTLRDFSSDSFGAASTKNKIRGAKLYAILAAIAKPVTKTAAPAAATSSTGARKRTAAKKTGGKKTGGKRAAKKGSRR